MTVVLSVSAYYRVNRELAIFDADMAHDHQILADFLAPTLSNAWLHGGRDEVVALVQKTGIANPFLRATWYDKAPSANRAPSTDLHFTDIPVVVSGQLVGYVELSESRGFFRDYVRNTIIGTALLTLALSLVTALVATVLGMWFVGRPVAKLVEKAKRIGVGELDQDLVISQKDEIGELAAEMNAMCVRLAEARNALASESEARVHAVEQLRHAERLATVGKLASGIAHELGTPLGVALMRANMIATGARKGEEAREAARIVSEQIDRITAIVRQLLDFARGRNSPAPGHVRTREMVELVAVARRTASLLQPMADKRGIRIDLQPCEDNFLCVPADVEQIQQVLMNLVMNAIHASEPGQAVRLRFQSKEAFAPSELTPAPTLDVPQANYAMVAVEDDGIGIPPDILPRIFEPFFTTKQVGEGTGLGLSVVYGIVRDHGGWIGVDSEQGKGTRFSVFLPMRRAHEPSGEWA